MGEGCYGFEFGEGLLEDLVEALGEEWVGGVRVDS